MFGIPKKSIYESTFVKSDETDAILVVDGKQLHVNKMLLSSHSDYFDALFNSDFKEKSMEEIPIEDVDFEDFVTVLSLVHAKPIEPNADNAENLLELANRFLIPTAKRHLEMFAMSTFTIERNEKIVLADRYNLEALLNQTLDMFHTKFDFNFPPSFKNLSSKTKAKIFDHQIKVTQK